MANVPKYVMIEEFIKNNIQNGTFEQGEPIFTEKKLSDMFKVTRMTVRQAITNLVNEGLLYRQKGSGTYVSSDKVNKLSNGLTSFTEDIRTSGKEPRTEVVSFEKIPASERLAKRLQIATGEMVYKIERVRYADNEPLGYEVVQRPVYFTPNLKVSDLEGSIYVNLEDSGLKIDYANQTMESILAGNTISKYLDISKNDPLLLIKSVTYISGDVPLQYTKSYYRSDKYKFSFRATR